MGTPRAGVPGRLEGRVHARLLICARARQSGQVATHTQTREVCSDGPWRSDAPNGRARHCGHSPRPTLSSSARRPQCPSSTSHGDVRVVWDRPDSRARQHRRPGAARMAVRTLPVLDQLSRAEHEPAVCAAKPPWRSRVPPDRIQGRTAAGDPIPSGDDPAEVARAARREHETRHDQHQASAGEARTPNAACYPGCPTGGRAARDARRG